MRESWAKPLFLFILSYGLSFLFFFYLTGQTGHAFFGNYLQSDVPSLLFYSTALLPVLFLLMLCLTGSFSHAFRGRVDSPSLIDFGRTPFLLSLAVGLLIGGFALISHSFAFQDSVSFLSLGQALYMIPLFFLRPFGAISGTGQLLFVLFFWLLTSSCGGYLLRRTQMSSRLLLGTLIGLLMAVFSYQGHGMAFQHPQSVSGLFGGSLYYFATILMLPFAQVLRMSDLMWLLVFWLIVCGGCGLLISRSPSRILLTFALIFALLPMIFFMRGCHSIGSYSSPAAYILLPGPAGDAARAAFGIDPFGEQGEGVDVRGITEFLEAGFKQDQYHDR